MDSRNTVNRIVGAVVLLLVLGQAWSLNNLRSDVRTLKTMVQNQQSQAGDRDVSRSMASDRASARTAQRGTTPSAEAPARAATERSQATDAANSKELAKVVERAMSKRDNEQKERRFQQRMAMMEESLTMQFDELAESYDLTVDQEEMATQLILASMEQGMDLRMQVGEGTISMMEAKEEGAAIKEETNQGVVELIGEEAAEALWAIMGNNK